jgi:hypothetical protein
LGTKELFIVTVGAPRRKVGDIYINYGCNFRRKELCTISVIVGPLCIVGKHVCVSFIEGMWEEYFIQRWLC